MCSRRGPRGERRPVRRNPRRRSGTVRVKAQGLDDARNAVPGLTDGSGFRVPNGDPTRGIGRVPPPAATLRPSSLNATASHRAGACLQGLNRQARIEVPEGHEGRLSGPPGAALASDRPSGPNATAVTAPSDPCSLTIGRPRATSQTPTTVGSRRVGAASRRPSRLKAKSPRGKRSYSPRGGARSIRSLPSNGSAVPSAHPWSSRPGGS